jgi:hypothetical protein
MEKNVFLTFCFSTIPGLGQMYQEYMKRGLSHLLLFALCILASIIFESGLFVLPIPVLIAYSFFDSFKLRNMYRRNEDMPKDEYLFEEMNGIKDIAKKRQPIIGVVLVFTGLYLLFNNIVIEILIQNGLQNIVEILHSITGYLPTLIVSIIAMWFGAKLIMNKGE